MVEDFRNLANVERLHKTIWLMLILSTVRATNAWVWPHACSRSFCQGVPYAQTT